MTLELSNVSITLGGRQLVKGLDLKLAPGEVVGLLGPNGAGKTTTFNLVIGLLSPDQGEVTVNGERVTHLPMPERARLGVGYLPQEASVFRNLTVRENLDVALEQTDLSSEQRRDRRQQLIDDFHLSAFINRLGFQLSGGERRRCEVARALASGANGPTYLLLDEPFASIDPIAVEEIQGIVCSLKEKEIGVLITDHNVRETLSITDRSYLLFDGEILKSGTSEFLADDEEARRLYLGEKFRLK